MPSLNPLTPSERWRALVRLWLGLAQMAGAVVSLVLLGMTGVNALSLGTAAFTTALSLTSRVLFGKRVPRQRTETPRRGPPTRPL